MTCRICHAPTTHRFSLDVLGGRHRADYVECQGCGALQVPDPGWLDEAYADPSAAVRADGGRFRRTFSVFLYLTALMDAGVLPRKPRLLDFGGGYGLLAKMLADAGHEAWTFDAYEKNRLFAVDRWVEELGTTRTYDVVTALEVFEHLTDPLRVARKLRSVLNDAGTLVLSTGIYDPQKHGKDWPYLAPATGQHVTFWSRGALRHLARELGFRTVAHFPGDEGILVLFSMLSPAEMQQKLSDADGVLNDPRHVQRATRGWDLRAGGWVKTVRPSRVEGLGEPADV